MRSSSAVTPVLCIHIKRMTWGGIDGELHLPLSRRHDLRGTLPALEADATGVEQRVGTVLHLAAITSRVTPGWSWTMEMRFRVSRFE